MPKLADPSSSDILPGMAPVEWNLSSRRGVPMPSQHFDGPWTGAAHIDDEVMTRHEEAGKRTKKAISGNLRWLLHEDFWSGAEAK
ncbi:MAG: hypothetical protein H6728_12700 [Myxococcales bacterium]|nr:hypothetical protein [Myxococcales bacterium]MCB9643927.1 hypothetical protein [Myxococcales bacterium]